MSWEKLIGITILSLFVIYMSWHLGRFYEHNRVQEDFYKSGSITSDAYNYYLLTKCLKGGGKL